MSKKITARKPHAIYFTEPSLTRGSFKEECDVANIVAGYQRTGIVSHVGRGTPQYGDAPEMSFFDAARIHAEIASREEEAALAPEEEVTASEPDSGEKALQEASEETSEAKETGEGTPVD